MVRTASNACGEKLRTIVTMTSPLHDIQEAAEAAFLPYGPADQNVQIVESFGETEAEYAAIRKGVGVMELPQRGVVEVEGNDRLDLLNRFLTNETKSLKAGTACRAFLLGRQGRITADLVVVETEDRTLLVMDIFQTADVARELEAFVFTEDVRFNDAAESWTHLALHGPEASKLVAAVSSSQSVIGVDELVACTHVVTTIAGHDCRLLRLDETGSPGLHLLAPRAGCDVVYNALSEALGGLVPEVAGGTKRPITGRGIGWLAYNTARIEAGTPLFHIDFGPDSLPHETGVLADAVSFTKGCYLGQEVVARMQSLGHPKKVLRGVRMQDERLPVAGCEVLDSEGTVCGAVTSSTGAPMLGGGAIAFAMIKWGRHRTGTKVQVPAEGSRVAATVQDLRFLG
jgi:folate-binding protein YgfZ